MKRHQLIWILVLILVLTTVLQGCGGSSSSGSQKVIRFGYQKGDEFNITKIRGTLAKTLKKQGYRVEWKEFQDGSSLLEALRAGSIDYGRTGNTPPVISQASGAGLVYVGVAHSKAEGSGILVKKNSSIHSLKDLKNKKVAFSKGSSSHYLVIKALEKAGLTIKDIKPVYLQPADARIAFEKGTVAAWAVWDPFTASAQREGNAKLLVNGKGLTTDRDFFLAKRDFAKNHKKLTQTIMNEVGDAMTWANHHHQELITELAKALKMDQKTIALSVNRRVYGIDKLTDSVMDEQQSIADQFYQFKLIPKKIDVRDALLN